MGYNPLDYKQLDTIEPHTHATWKGVGGSSAEPSKALIPTDGLK